jgi:hypothetical protein
LKGALAHLAIHAQKHSDVHGEHGEAIVEKTEHVQRVQPLAENQKQDNRWRAKPATPKKVMAIRMASTGSVTQPRGHKIRECAQSAPRFPVHRQDNALGGDVHQHE